MDQIAFRISRLISFITIIVWIIFLYNSYQYYFVSTKNFNNGNITLEEVMAKWDLSINIFYITIATTLILLIFNYVAFGKISVWIKKPAPKEED